MMRPPGRHSSYVARLGSIDRQDIAGLAARLEAVPGVVEAVIAPDEGVAYLKIDRTRFDEAALAPIIGG
jgi:hypothetical protein